MDNDLYTRLDNLYFYIANRYGWQCPLLDVISARINELQFPARPFVNEEIIDAEPVMLLLDAEVV